MRIYAKKAFGFRNPEDHKKLVTTRPNGFQEVPGWVGNDPMFTLAKEAGDIEVIQVSPSVASSASSTKKKSKTVLTEQAEAKDEAKEAGDIEAGGV